jgi:hypothetical protein
MIVSPWPKTTTTLVELGHQSLAERDSSSYPILS